MAKREQNMEKDELRAKIYSKIEEIPTIPVVLPRLLSLMEDNRNNASIVADVISRDPALASKILKVANSAYYGFQQKISETKKALCLLGFNMVKSLALSIGVISSLPRDERTPHFSWQGLWIHSLAVATVMKKLSERSQKENGDDYLFIVGLLHDIGKVVLDQFFTELFRQALEDAGSGQNTALHEAERRVIGFDHGEVGAMLLKRWKFPDVIGELIYAHHLKEIPEGIRTDDIAMLRIADAVSREIGLGEGGNPVAPEILNEDIRALQIGEEELDGIKGFLEETREGIYEFFSALN